MSRSKHEPNYRLLDTWGRLASMYLQDQRIDLALIDCEKEVNNLSLQTKPFLPNPLPEQPCNAQFL